MKHILEYLENTANRFPEKVGFTDEGREITFRQMQENSQRLASALHREVGNPKNVPVAVLLERSVACVEGMFAVLYAGDFYTVIDIHSPVTRMEHIVDTLGPVAVITDREHRELAERIGKGAPVLCYEDMMEAEIDEAFLAERRRDMIDTDPAYVLFTSGSSGLPKGAVLTHKNVLRYSEWVSETFRFDENTVFGSQTPLYFSMSVTDLYSTIRCGCTYHIIPKQMFTFPMNLMAYMNEKKVNTIYWVPSAMGIVADWDTFQYSKPEHLDTVLFAGEVMPVKHLNYWRKHLPDCQYANLFGPTETTDICTYYVVDREFAETESLPIGRSCDNCDVLLVTEDGREAEAGEEGELYVRGSFVAEGYYSNVEKTAEAFPQNPLQSCYPEKVYRTGDIAKYNADGELLYVNRRDFQIKRRGYRIELGEIEAAAILVEGVKKAAAIYDFEKEEILVFYEGKPKDPSEFLRKLADKIPSYMAPDQGIRMKSIPYNANGKIDREALKAEYITK